MKLAYVVPRYGPDVVGGAEQACRMLAEAVAAHTAWDVEVLTTTAVDSATWAPAAPPEETTENGVVVRRFPTSPRQAGFDAVHQAVIVAPETTHQQDRWLEMQGPASPELLDAVAASGADVTCFTPYLFHPTVRGLPVAPGATVLHPATHDEPAARLPLFRPLFAGASALCFYSDAERRLTDRLFGVAHRRQCVIGLGVDAGEGDAGTFRATHGLGEDPYLLCVGRVDASKGTAGLARAFTALKEEWPGPLRLVLVGQVVEPPPPHPDIVITGTVTEEAKWGALRGAVALVSPSRHESFSLVLLEAWQAGIPVVVHAACPATADHVARSGGGLTFSDLRTFADRKSVV